MYIDLLHGGGCRAAQGRRVRPALSAILWIGYLARRGIETVWHESGFWHGTPEAVAGGLADVAMDAERFASGRKRPT